MENFAITAAAMGLVGTFVGALLTTGVTLFNAHRQRRSEVDARVISAAFNFAALEWRGHLDEMMHSKKDIIFPPTVYLVHALGVANLVHKNKEININDLIALKSASDELARKLMEFELRRPSKESKLTR